MRNLKKVIMLLLAAVLVFALAACGTQGSGASDHKDQAIENNEGNDAEASDTTEAAASDDAGSSDSGQAVKPDYSTKDMNGNSDDLMEIFARNKITMVNIWASWCMYCVQEMPKLQAMSEEYKDKGVEIIGYLSDGDLAEPLAEAKDIVQQAGVTYTNLLPTPTLAVLFGTTVYPTTLFIGPDGTMIADPVMGAEIDQYKATLDQLLAE